MNRTDMNILVCLPRCVSLDAQVGAKLLCLLFVLLDREVLFSGVTELANAHSSMTHRVTSQTDSISEQESSCARPCVGGVAVV